MSDQEKQLADALLELIRADEGGEASPAFYEAKAVAVRLLLDMGYAGGSVNER